jgi:hypothetical protein
MKEYIMRIFERKPGDISTEHCIASLEIRKDNLGAGILEIVMAARPKVVGEPCAYLMPSAADIDYYLASIKLTK